MDNIKNIFYDDIIPVIAFFSLIISLLLSANFPLRENRSRVLGVSDPPSEICLPGVCGFCRQCGGEDGISCGQSSRCTENKDRYSCRFDIKCL